MVSKRTPASSSTPSDTARRLGGASTTRTSTGRVISPCESSTGAAAVGPPATSASPAGATEARPLEPGARALAPGAVTFTSSWPPRAPWSSVTNAPRKNAVDCSSCCHWSSLSWS
ncbi:Uncharacterised protein [Bordetella pertussis]|nr:Uncharacterised protein [Bordetella pertussis]